MRLNPEQIGELTALVVSAYDRDQFAILVQTRLQIDLEADVDTDGPWKVVAYRFHDHVNGLGRMTELLQTVRKDREKRADLVAKCDELLAILASGGSGMFPRLPRPDDLRKAIGQFNAGFRVRNELFKYLDAFKRLHDVLHELQGLYLEVEAAVKERIADPTRPLKDDMAFLLEDKVRTATEAAADTEFPDRPPKWIAKLSATVAILLGSNVQRMPRELEKLRLLPSENLSEMNKDLLDNASRLQPRDMIGALDGIRNALGPEAAALRTRVEGFRNLCAELDNLIRAHNLCQTIDDALLEAAGLESVTPGELTEWPAARKSLDELAAQRKTDRRVERTTKAAVLFEAADQGRAFGTLLECFTDLFMETDKALLRLTNRMPREALALHQALEDVS